jgi:anti-sigma-K factor RskA
LDIQAYISSGIIENYVLGTVTAEEAREVETYCLQYPEIKAAVDDYAATLEQYAKLQAATPPEGLKGKIWAKLREPANRKPGSEKYSVVKNIKAKTIMVVHPVMRYLTAASITLLIGSLALNMVFYNKFLNYKNKYSQLQIAQHTIVAQNQTYETRLNQLQNDMDIIKNPSMQPVVMKGVSEHPGMMATVFWNKKSGAVYLAVNKLPPPPPGKQYQLWAIINGKPVSAGMCDVAIVNDMMQKMSLSTANAQAFAITLEKAGGSDVPTLSAMYVMGKV